MNTDHLRYFLTVARSGSISKAADALHFKQQYVSSIIKNLEEQLGVTLFERGARGVTLTKDGRYLKDKAEAALAIIDEIEQPHFYPSYTVHRQAFDLLTLYILPALTLGNLTAVLTQYGQFFPNVTVNIEEKTHPEIIDALQKNPTSLGLTLITEEEYAALKGRESALLVFADKRIRFQAVTRADNPELKTLAHISMAALMEKPLVIHAPRGLEHSFVQQALVNDQKPNIKYIASNSALFHSLMSSGDYWSITSTMASLSATLTAIPISDTVTIYSAFVIHKNALSSFPTKALLELFLRKSNHSIRLLNQTIAD